MEIMYSPYIYDDIYAIIHTNVNDFPLKNINLNYKQQGPH